MNGRTDRRPDVLEVARTVVGSPPEDWAPYVDRLTLEEQGLVSLADIVARGELVVNALATLNGVSAVATAGTLSRDESLFVVIAAVASEQYIDQQDTDLSQAYSLWLDLTEQDQ